MTTREQMMEWRRNNLDRYREQQKLYQRKTYQEYYDNVRRDKKKIYYQYKKTVKGMMAMMDNLCGGHSHPTTPPTASKGDCL